MHPPPTHRLSKTACICTCTCMCMCTPTCMCMCIRHVHVHVHAHAHVHVQAAHLVQQPPRLLVVRGAVLGEQPQLPCMLGSGLRLGEGSGLGSRLSMVRTRARAGTRAGLGRPTHYSAELYSYYGSPRRRRVRSATPRWAGSSMSPGSKRDGQCSAATSPRPAPRRALQQGGSARRIGMPLRALQRWGSARRMGLHRGWPRDRPLC